MHRKTKRLEIRLTPEQKALLRRAAEIRAESLTQFILHMSETGARQVVEEAQQPVHHFPAGIPNHVVG